MNSMTSTKVIKKRLYKNNIYIYLGDFSFTRNKHYTVQYAVGFKSDKSKHIKWKWFFTALGGSDPYNEAEWVFYHPDEYIAKCGYERVKLS